jgi:FKBP-type peptidyl-prolyl cis-trans isomerase
MRLLLVSVIAVSLSGCSGNGSGNPPTNLESAQDSLSYVFGADVGAKIKVQLTSMGLDVDAGVVSGAVKDVLSGADLKLSDAETKAVIKNYSSGREAEAAKKAHGGGAYEAAQANLKAGQEFLVENASKEGVVVLDSGLQYRVITEGGGASPKATDRVTVHYAGRLLDGSEFDSSYKRGKPATFALNGVIKGWTEGLQLMKEGATYEFYIPGDLAYGSRGRPSIPANATLIFKVELIKVE